MDEEERPKKRPAHEIGQDLSLLSIAELEDRVAELRAEILRLETARGQKLAAQNAAHSFFKS
jgi:uncharacterized small protein (DUF1192 family)